jgi:AcrR family transcriptional regulator
MGEDATIRFVLTIDDGRPPRGGSGSATRRTRSERLALDSARGLLADGGVQRLTVEGVAARSGIAKTTIYRRWRSKEDLALAVLLEMTEAVVDVPELEDTRSELIAFVARAIDILGSTLMGRVMQGLASDIATDPTLAQAFRDRVVSLRLAELRHLIQRGIDRGELRDDIDARLLHDLLFGPVYHRLLLTGGTLDHALAEQIVDTLIPSLTGRI